MRGRGDTETRGRGDAETVSYMKSQPKEEAVKQLIA
jgi:hypothetical protein